MKRIPRTYIANTLMVVALLAASAGAQSQKKLSDEEKAKAAAAAEELAKPGAEHQRLEALAGRWDQEFKFWPAQGQPPIQVTGKSVNTMILGGRFLKIESKGGQGAFQFETLQMFGFDRRKKVFTQVGYDTQGTYYVAAAGVYDPSQNALVLDGADTDPALGTQKYKTITRYVSPTKFIVEILFTDPVHTGGKGEIKVAEITSTLTGKE